MNRLPLKRQKQIIAALCEGCSIRSTVRMTGASKNTILKLLESVGKACIAFHDANVKGVKSKRIECDEIWTFVKKKAKRIPESQKDVLGIGDAWTWTAIDADSKLIVSFLIGKRDLNYARAFIEDVASRLSNRVQLTTDGLKAYLQAVEDTFGADVDYSVLNKIYGSDHAGEARYSPPTCIGIKKEKIEGNPDMKKASTSYVERQNLTMRMSMRRFTRLTNGFSKKLENLIYAVALYFVHYNFCRIHQSLRVTPAMEAGLSDHVWEIEEILGLLNAEKSN